MFLAVLLVILPIYINLFILIFFFQRKEQVGFNQNQFCNPGTYRNIIVKSVFVLSILNPTARSGGVCILAVTVAEQSC